MESSVQQHGNQGDSSPVLNADGSIHTTIVQGSEIYPSHLHRLTAILGLLFDGVVVFLSGGIPYWYYRLFHLAISNNTELGDIGSTRVSHRSFEQWSDRFRQLSKVWKIHQVIIGAVLAPMFPLLSVSPLPKCSWAYIFAVLCLVFGLITFTISIIHRAYLCNIDASEFAGYIASDTSFFDEDVIRFYVSLSLPSIWFPGFVASFTLTILMIIIGVQASHDHLEIDPSCNNNSTFLLAMVPIIFVIAVISFVRSIKYMSKKSQGTA